MKRQISVLDQNTIDKIAAGEVVERPASVVKELVENAVDAGASAITVEIKEGGISFIRITDNGAGIEKEQVPLAFLRHATSKIRKVDDLVQISSLGFRGEALSSIAAVSQVEVITKPQDQFIGVRYEIEGGIEKGIEDIGAPDGTTFLVRNLFYNTPARAKFLKTPTTEAGYISTYLEQLALSHPHISFKYIQNGQTKLHTSGNDNLKEVIYHIYGREITRELLEIKKEDPVHGFELHGFIGKPTVSRGNRNFENYYVNGRYVKSKLLMKAIEDGYHTFMMQHKYPFTSLCLTISGEEVDVNVHPTKMEVRFSNQEYIYRQVYEAIKETLSKRELIPEVTLDTPATMQQKPIVSNVAKQKPAIINTAISKSAPSNNVPSKVIPSKTVPSKAIEPKSAPVKQEIPRVEVNKSVSIPLVEKPVVEKKTLYAEPFEVKRREAEKKQQEFVEKTQEVKQLQEAPVYGKMEQMELFDGKLLSKEAKSHHKIIGQVFDTYWLVQMDEKLFIIDQHAAHEKVLYERIVQQMKTRQVTSQLLSPPLIISLNLQEQEKMKQYQEVFQSIGFEIEAFGGKEYSIRSVPQNLYGMTGESFFIELLDQLDDNPTGKTLETISDRMATMACKAAVKGNQSLSFAEAKALIDELLELENPYNCPHGRPTIISMTKYELEKKFKRIV